MIDTLKKRLSIFYASWCFLIVIKIFMDLFFINSDKIKHMLTINILPIFIIGCIHIITYFLKGYKSIYLQLGNMIITAMIMIVASVVDQYWLLLSLMIGQNAYFYNLYSKHTLLKVSFSIFVVVLIVGLAIGFNIRMGKTEEIFHLTIRHYINHALFWILPIGNTIIGLYYNQQRLQNIFSKKDKELLEKQEQINELKEIAEGVKAIEKKFIAIHNEDKYIGDNVVSMRLKTEDYLERRKKS